MGSKQIHLTKKEFILFSYLNENRGRIVSKEKLRKVAWNDTIVGQRTLDTHIINLRKKIKDSGLAIKTKFGVGLYIS